MIRQVFGETEIVTPDRLFLLGTLLSAQQQVSAQTLADQLGVSVRTVLRDPDWLKDAGYPLVVTRGRHGGISLVPGTSLHPHTPAPAPQATPVAGLDERQQEALGPSHECQRSLRLPLSELVVVDNRGWFEPPAEGVTPAHLLDAVRSGRRLRIRYRHSGQPAARWEEVDPYGLLAKAGRWYLVADRAGRPRLFAAVRLAEIEQTHTPRQLRAGVTLAQAAASLTEAAENPGEVLVTCRLLAQRLDLARRLLQGRITEVRADPDGTDTVIVVFACRVVDAVRQLMQFGADLEVLDPPAARDRVIAGAQGLLARYQAPLDPAS